MRAMVYLWGSKNNLRELVLAFSHVDSAHWTQIIRLGSKCLHQLSQLASSKHTNFCIISSVSWVLDLFNILSSHSLESHYLSLGHREDNHMRSAVESLAHAVCAWIPKISHSVFLGSVLILNSGLGQLFGKRSPYISTYTSWSSFDLASTSLDLCLFFCVPPLLPVPVTKEDTHWSVGFIGLVPFLRNHTVTLVFYSPGCSAALRWLRVDERRRSHLRVFPSFLRSERRIAHPRAG